MNDGSRLNRRRMLGWTAALAAGSALAPVTLSAETSHDWSQRLVDSTMQREPNAPAFNHGWTYPAGLFLFGAFLLYRRTHDPKLLIYIRQYVDAHVDERGRCDTPIESLDSVLPANLLVALFEETREPRYKVGAETFRHRFDTYPRTSDGGFWHGNRPERAWQLWLDGNYMALQFLLRFGRAFGDSAYTNAEAVKQLLIYHKHLKSDHMGLLYHAWDESGKADWADPVTHHSGYFWCRSLGWYSMMLIDTLDVIPRDQPGREELLTILRDLLAGVVHYQDAASGLWFELIDQPSLKGNWTETSSSSMFTYSLHVAVKRGYVPRSYLAAARKGYQGVLGRLTADANGLTDLADIVVGTNVGDLQWYLDRPRKTNDPHGLGAFLLMNEEWNHSHSSMRY